MKERIKVGERAETGAVEEARREEKKIGKTINEYLKERGIDAPPIKIKMWFGGHEKVEDMTGFEEAFRECDVFAPEWPGKTKKMQKDLDSLARGDLTTHKFLELYREVRISPFYSRMATLIYNSGKKVILIDLRRTDVGFGQIVHEFQYENGFGPAGDMSKEPFETALEKYKIKLKRFADLVVVKRNEKALGEVGPSLKDVFEKNPKLLVQKTVKVFSEWGAIHTKISHELSKNDEDIERIFSAKPLIFGYLHEAERRLEFGLPVPDELYVRAMFEVMINRQMEDYFKINHDNTVDEIKAKRKFVSQFSVDDLKNVLTGLDFNNATAKLIIRDRVDVILKK